MCPETVTDIPSFIDQTITHELILKTDHRATVFASTVVVSTIVLHTQSIPLVIERLCSPLILNQYRLSVSTIVLHTLSSSNYVRLCCGSVNNSTTYSINTVCNRATVFASADGHLSTTSYRLEEHVDRTITHELILILILILLCYAQINLCPGAMITYQRYRTD